MDADELVTIADLFELARSADLDADAVVVAVLPRFLREDEDDDGERVMSSVGLEVGHGSEFSSVRFTYGAVATNSVTLGELRGAVEAADLADDALVEVVVNEFDDRFNGDRLPTELGAVRSHGSDRPSRIVLRLG